MNNEIKRIDIKQAIDNEIHRGGLPPKMQKHFDNRIWQYDCRCPPNFQSIPLEPVITEDIDCEIIEPAKLPPPSPDAQ